MGGALRKALMETWNDREFRAIAAAVADMINR
jgi:hypothetical protein